MTAPQTRGRKRQCAPLGQTGVSATESGNRRTERFSVLLRSAEPTSTHVLSLACNRCGNPFEEGLVGGLGEKFAFRHRTAYHTDSNPHPITGKGRAELHPQFGSFLTSRSPFEAILAIVLLVCSDYGGGGGLFSSPLRRLFRSFSSARTHPLPNDPGDIPTAFSTLPSLRG